MSKFLLPTNSPEDWKKQLVSGKQWREGYSAKELAYCWEGAKGFPPSVMNAFKKSDIDLFREVQFLYGFPEYNVPLPGGAAGSQNDLYVLGKAGDELITIMVEGKVDEPFGPTIASWYGEDPSKGKKKRLNFLLETLELEGMDVVKTRYQLLHRAASAVIEAKRIGAKHALMLIHSFSEIGQWYEDYEAFIDLFPVIAEKDCIVGPAIIGDVNLYFGWVSEHGR
ncbi:DUF6946 family protein [Alteribacter aurantiacus]|uniref:DUF6946 family protein n=1 Tax=Alteribacter aurantiacus TaxID=254410 RepID=UPI000407CFE7|nr:hypothetical protein [Alteribacter aurantiacus]